MAVSNKFYSIRSISLIFFLSFIFQSIVIAIDAPININGDILYPPAKFSQSSIPSGKIPKHKHAEAIQFLQQTMNNYRENKIFNSLENLIQFINVIKNRHPQFEETKLKAMANNAENKITASDLSILFEAYKSFNPQITQTNEKVKSRHCVTSSLELCEVINKQRPEYNAQQIACTITSKDRKPYYEFNSIYHHVACIVSLSENIYALLDPGWPFIDVIKISDNEQTCIDNNSFSLSKNNMDNKDNKDNKDAPKIEWLENTNENKIMKREFPLKTILNPMESVIKPMAIASSAVMLESFYPYPNGGTRLLFIIDYENGKIFIEKPLEEASNNENRSIRISFSDAETKLFDTITEDWANQLGYINKENLYNQIMLVIKWSPVLKEMKEYFKIKRMQM
ncbi:MAG: hypothetical protein HQK49_18295 [Oligoflexia bacterium]|nr:hypothetical protein [Oligoflexia bacterium]